MGDSVVVACTLHGDPIPKKRPRTQIRYRRDGKPYPHTYTPQESIDAEKVVGMALLAAGARRPETEARLEVELKFYTATAVRGDVDNLAKLVLDAANGLVWKDDRQVMRLTAEIVERDHRPRTEIVVLRRPGSQATLDLGI